MQASPDKSARQAATFNALVDAPRAIVKKPMAVYIENVYEEGDFALRRAQNYAGLGIGTWSPGHILPQIVGKR